MAIAIIENAACFDGFGDELLDGVSVAIEGDRIREVSDRSIGVAADRRIDGRDRTLMPGLIDARVHVYAADLSLTRVMRRPWTYLAHYAGTFLRHMLHSGYTTVRDTGGGDYGLAGALRDGWLEGDGSTFSRQARKMEHRAQVSTLTFRWPVLKSTIVCTLSRSRIFREDVIDPSSRGTGRPM